jgi:hypothetical protein
LLGINTLAYYKNSYIKDKFFHNIGSSINPEQNGKPTFQELALEPNEPPPPPPLPRINLSDQVNPAPNRGPPASSEPTASSGKANLLEEIRRKGGYPGAGLNKVDPGRRVGHSHGGADQGKNDMMTVLHQALAVIQQANRTSDDEEESDEANSNGSWCQRRQLFSFLLKLRQIRLECLSPESIISLV